MADSSVEAGRSSASSSPWAQDGRIPESAAYLFYGIRRERPRVVVKADLLPAISILSTVGLLGFPLAWLWSRLAPPERVRVLPNNDLAPLQLETWHRADDLVIFLLLGLATGIVAGTVVWLLRERRGPVAMIAAVGGAVLAGWLGTLLGPAFVNSMYAVSTPPSVGDVIEKAPVLTSWWAVFAPALTTALVYGMLAAWNGRDDLGRRLG